VCEEFRPAVDALLARSAALPLASPVREMSEACTERERALVRMATDRAASFMNREDRVALVLHGNGMDDLLAELNRTHPPREAMPSRPMLAAVARSVLRWRQNDRACTPPVVRDDDDLARSFASGVTPDSLLPVLGYYADAEATPPPRTEPSEAETGACGICGCDVTTDPDTDEEDDDDPARGSVYMLPVTNGVYSTPTRTLLCEPCAFDMADRNSEAAEESDS
jgi:hypothetical protein